MDLPYVIKTEEEVEYFLIATPDEEITVATTFDKYSTDTNEIHRRIKEEPAEPCEYSNDQKNDPDFEPYEDQLSSESEEIEKPKGNDSDEDWCMEKKRKRPNGKSRVKSVKSKFKYHEISTEILTCNGPPYTCTICSLTFPDEKPFRIHHRIHQGKNYQCAICNKVFRKKIHIYEHMKAHGEQKYSCPICEKTFAIKKSWLHHKAVHEEKKFECDLCSKRFRQKGHLWEHMKVHRERTKQYKCELCEMAYYEQRTLTRHMRLTHSNTPRKTFRCPNTLCDKSYSSVASFKMHACVDGKRPESNFKASCPECGKWFYNRFEMNRHMKRTHIDKGDDYVCKMCNKIFLSRYWDNYVMHVAQNCAYPIMYKCDRCWQLIPSKPKIIEHFADKHGIISELMNLACPKCPKKFLFQSKLNFHLKSAHNKKWNCECCGKKFRSASGCSVHQKHCVPKMISDKYSKYVNGTDETSAPNECSICNRSFLKKIYLIEHMEVVHSEKNVNSKTKLKTVSKVKSDIRKDEGAFKCKQCNKSFTRATFYKRHLKSVRCLSHANKQQNEIHQYQCTICSKIYERNCYLKRHITQAHSQESIFYECKLCARKFNAKRSLQRHLDKGDHRTSFQCTGCLKHFKRMGAYKVHQNYCKLKIESKECELVLS